MIDLTERAKLDLAYGNLAMSTRHRPRRSAFKKVALDRGMTEDEFDEWAKKKGWEPE
jgi:hypothetical protein